MQGATWERLLLTVAEYREAELAGHRERARALYTRGIAEFGDEQWEHAFDYVMTPTVKEG